MKRHHCSKSSWLAGAVIGAFGCANVTNELPTAGGSNGVGATTGGSSSNGGAQDVAGANNGTAPMGTGGAAPSGGGTGSGTGGTLNAGSTGGALATGGTTYVPVAASIPLPYTDDFEDGNLDEWLVWNSSTSALGVWAVSTDGANHVLQQSANGSSATWNVGGDVKWTDQKVSVKARWADTSTYIYVSARFNNTDGYYYLQVVPGSKPKIRVRNSGSTTDVCAGSVNFAGIAGTWYTLTITAQGSTFSADIDGTAICSGASSAIAAGGIAVGTDGGPAAFDDVSVTGP